MTFCFVCFFVFCYWVVQIFFFFYNEKIKGFHAKQHLFLHYGQFLQNLKKGFIQTNMHTTVIHKSTVFSTQSSSHIPTVPIRSGAPAMSGQQASFAVLFKVCMHLLNVLNQFCQLYIHASSMFAYSNSFFIQKFS